MIAERYRTTDQLPVKPHYLYSYQCADIGFNTSCLKALGMRSYFTIAASSANSYLKDTIN